MACEHKFKKYLNLDKLDFDPTTLIVGTFNPLVEGNKAQWFYGRFDNNFWDVLPRIYNKHSMRGATPKDWKIFCNENHIAITDLLESIEDADLTNVKDKSLITTYSDKSIAEEFKSHKFIDIVEILKSQPTIRNIYITRGIGATFWKRLWKPVVVYGKTNNINVKNLITPSGYAFYQQGKYNKDNPQATLKLEDYILMRWKEEWHDIKK